uniref:Ubiquitin carboxyl-terminal hydrolase n=1 Tax=Cacopsylla melanoneura TaxID=428564 RepID=A0A8D8Y6N5_9HEMI
MDPLTPEKIDEIQKLVDTKFKPSNYTKISEFDMIDRALGIHKKGIDFYKKGLSVSAYQNFYLFASWATMLYKKPKDVTYVKTMLKDPLKSCMDHLEKMKIEAENLKEKEKQKKLKELKDQENQKRLQELRKKVVPSSDSRLNNNNASSAVNLNNTTLYNGHHKSDYIIKPEDKYEPTTPRVQTSLSCTELQKLLKDNENSVLLIDCRSQSEFNACTLKTGKDNLINIPPEINVIGQSARVLGDKLGEQHKTLWDIRSTFDRIVLFDSFSRVNRDSLDTSLERLVMIIREFDVNTVYKAPPVILEGGFEAWYTLYPYHTNNPTNHKPAIPFTVPVPTNINTINYSCLLDDTPPSPPPASDPTPAPPPSNSTVLNGGDVLGSEMDYPSTGGGGGGARVRDPSEEGAGGTASVGPSYPGGTSSATNGELTSSYFGPNHREVSSGGSAGDPPMEIESGGGPSYSSDQATLSRVVKPMPHVDRSSKPSENTNDVQVRPFENGTESPGAERSNRMNNNDGEVRASHTERLRFDDNMKGGEETRRPSLKSFGGSKLNRSSSFSDLSRMNGGDTLHEGRSSNVPEFDRSKKPYQDRLSHYSSVAGTNVGPGLTGLKNLGNTCYINSILQCLSNTSPLRAYFESEFKKSMASYGRNNVTRPGSAGGKLAEEFQLIFKMLWAGESRYFSPVKFKEEVGKMKRTFRGYEQQDSHEFLTILIDSLHEDLKEPEHKNSLTGALVESGEKSWGEFLKKNKSIVSQLFYGQLKSTVMCLSCQETSSTFEVFSNVSVPLPANDRCTLKDCLELYLQGEEIQGWHCPRCKTKRDARKKLDITILPPILVLHFKRFTSDGWCRKKQTTVEFPENNLSMNEYNLNPESRDSRYDLYAISNHYGTMESGHYTAYCRNKYKWYKFDDSDVSEISSSKLVSPAAYILFYMSSRLEH